MAITFSSGFSVSSAEAIDIRLVKSKAEMLSVIESRMPSTYFCICSDDGYLYLFDKRNISLSDTGKFRLAADPRSLVIEGYYDSTTDTFFKEEAKINPLAKILIKFYKDKKDGLIYYVDSNNNNSYSLLFKKADENTYGLVKLYKLSGENEDGSMTQKSVTNAVNEIKFEIITNGGENCLNLKKPW